MAGVTRAEAYLRQARSDFAIYELLQSLPPGQPVPECHPLHYFQMATEKLSKAVLLRSNPGFSPYTHVVLSKLPATLEGNASRLAAVLGYGNVRSLRVYLRSMRALFDEVEKLQPDVAHRKGVGPGKTNPNVEYPWEGRHTNGAQGWLVPAEHEFQLLGRLQTNAAGIQMPMLIKRLLECFDQLF
jgi:hypothetical protein